MTSQSGLRWELDVDDAFLENAERDVTRALILQNARTAQRFDPFSGFRSHRSEALLRRLGIGLAALGTFLATVGVVLAWMSTRSLHPVLSGLLGAMLLLMIVFHHAPGLRARAVDGLDRRLGRLAKRVLVNARKDLPVRLQYEVTALEVRCDARNSQESTDPTPRFRRALADYGYALSGDHCLLLFSGTRSLTPGVVLFSRDESHRSSLEAFVISAGLAWERLHHDLLPRSTVERHW